MFPSVALDIKKSTTAVILFVTLPDASFVETIPPYLFVAALENKRAGKSSAAVDCKARCASQPPARVTLGVIVTPASVTVVVPTPTLFSEASTKRVLVSTVKSPVAVTSFVEMSPTSSSGFGPSPI